MYHAEQVKDYIQDRIENISNSYNMLSFSHDRLEQSLISKPVTLRSALEQLQQLLSNSSKELTPEIADLYLQQLAYYCSLEVAGLYLFDRDKLNSNPIAKIGKVKSFEQNDILVQQCLEKGVTTYIAVNQLDSNDQSQYLAVAPFKSSDNQLLGLLAVEEMPFLALTEDTLKTLAMLLSYFADSIVEKNIGEKILKKFPSCPLQFAEEIFKLKNLQKHVNVDSAVVCWYFSADPQRDNYIFKIEQQRRGLDSLWRTKNKEREVLLILMPISDQSTVAGYEHRISNLLQEEFGVTVGQKTISMAYRQLSAYKNPLTLIEELLENK